MNKLIESQMEILTTYYARRFDAWEAWGDLNDVVERHGNQTKYYIYKSLCKYKRTIIRSYNNKFVCEMDCKKNYSLYNDINTDY